MNVPISYSTGFVVSNEVKDKISFAINEHSGKYLHNCDGCTVSIKQKDQHMIEVDLRLSYSYGIIIRTSGVTRLHNDYQVGVMAAFNDALHKADRQMQKYKSRIIDKKKHKDGVAQIMAEKFVFDYSEYSEDVDYNSSVSVIREDSSVIKIMSTQDAIVELDVTGLPAIMFIEENSNKVAVMYYRKDGNVSLLISPR